MDLRYIYLENEIKELRSKVLNLEKFILINSNAKYRMSMKGRSSSMYRGMKRRNKLRGHGELNFTLNEFRKWLDNNPKWMPLYIRYKESGCDIYFSPSCDRVFENVGYSLDNIELMTWKLNLKKPKQKKIKSLREKEIKFYKGKKINFYKEKKTVEMFTINGELISTFESGNEAARITGIAQPSISNCCNNVKYSNTAGGYIWKFK